MNQGNNCPVCHSDKYQKLSYGGYIWRGTTFPLVRCVDCSLKYIKHQLNNDDINQLYQAESYFDSEYGGGASKHYWENESWAKVKARQALKKIKPFVKEGKILDLGCAGGYFLTVAEEEFGYEAYGLELSQSMALAARERGLRVATGSIADVPADWPKFDLIYLGDVLEHVADPYFFMDLIKGKLAPGGVVAIEVPLTYEPTLIGVASAVFNLLKGKIGGVYFLPAQHRTKLMPKPPYHLLMFNPKAMRCLLTKLDLTVLYLKTWEGEAKDKFNSRSYRLIKQMSHWLTDNFKQSFFGDRLIVIAKKQN